ncbi:MAG TPA: rRNA adenine N-6-methyltransferase family protein [Verrucomicrobiae bacterium]|nr:rRNA adenine N-6-methyltransferase family protein [Verrucomicrobiae bacterium]
MEKGLTEGDILQASKPRGAVSQFLLFARNFLKHPNLVGWMLPSSPWVVKDVLRHVDWDKAKVIVEYGPGVGTFTKRVLELMRPDAALIAIEINRDFHDYLQSSIKDPRLRLIKDSAANVAEVLARLGFSHADYVISGIPFKTLPEPVCDSVVRNTYSVLRPEGSFLVYQLSSAVLPYLEKVFGKVARDTQILSFIPARLFYCAR